MSRPDWPEDMIERATELWRSGHSVAEVQRALASLGFRKSRSAVIGKMNRLHGPRGDVQNGKNGPRGIFPKGPKNLTGSGREVAQRPRSMAERMRVAFICPKDVMILSLDELEGGVCRWPFDTDDGEHAGFCGCKAAPGSPYCEFHTEIARSQAAKKAA
ncbi:MAG: GcrA family cell cycle regulator [Pseudomonadota bacterium]